MLEEFAAGGMASVHYGRMTGAEGFRRIVAIKRMHPGLKQESQAREALLDEGKLAARVQHVNVVQTLDVVADGDELLLVLEYVTGESLDKLLKAAARAQAPLPEGVAVAIVSGTLRGLHAAHLARAEDGKPLELVHRDVSPHNILIDVSGVPRVTDFGIAKARGRLQSTQSGQLKGKLSYVAPEQIHGESSPASDIFSTGIVLWECLALSRLFKGSNEAETLSAVLRCEVPPIEGANPALQQIARTALSRLPNQRYATALQMAEALEATGLWASPSEISAWMWTLVPTVLTERERRVRALEQDSYSSLKPVPGPGSQRWQRLALALAMALVAVGAVAARGFLFRGTDQPPAEAAMTSPVQGVDAGAESPEVVPSPAVAEPVAVDAGLVREIVVAPKPRPRPGPKKNDCAVPYNIDRNGRKKYKMECL